MTTTDTTSQAARDEAVYCDRGDDAPANGWHDRGDGDTEYLCAPHYYEPTHVTAAAQDEYWAAIADGEPTDVARASAEAWDFNERPALAAIEAEEAACQAADDDVAEAGL